VHATRRPAEVLAAAPTVPFTLQHQSPSRLLRTVLARLGDRSLVPGRIEGDRLEAEDANNFPAFAFSNAERGTGVGSQWARCARFYPFEHTTARGGDRPRCSG